MGLTLFENHTHKGAEKITNIRIEAGVTLLAYLRSSRSDIGDLAELKLKLALHGDTLNNEKSMRHKRWRDMWGNAKCFPKYTDILHLESIQRPILTGLLVSSGDLTQSLSSAAGDCLLDYVDRIQDEADLVKFVNSILSLWKNDKKNLLTKPVLKVFDEFLSKCYHLTGWPSGLRRQIKALVSSEAWVRIPLQSILF